VYFRINYYKYNVIYIITKFYNRDTYSVSNKTKRFAFGARLGI